MRKLEGISCDELAKGREGETVRCDADDDEVNAGQTAAAPSQSAAQK